MALLEDLKLDLKQRIDNVQSVTDMLILYEGLDAPLDLTVIEPYFKWYRLKALDEDPDFVSNTDLYSVYFTSEYVKLTREVDQVRLLDTGTELINQALRIRALPEMVEEIVGGTNDSG